MIAFILAHMFCEVVRSILTPIQDTCPDPNLSKISQETLCGGPHSAYSNNNWPMTVQRDFG